MILTGTSLQPLDLAGTSLLWRSQTRHGVAALNTSTGRFRMTVDDLLLYMLAPEGTATSTNVIYRFSFAKRQWSRLVYTQVNTFLSISKEPSGNLIAGDDAGNVWQLDVGEQDDSNPIRVTLLTPESDAGNPVVYKDAFDLQLHCHTGGSTGTATLYKDSSVVDPFEYEFTTSGSQVYRIDTSDFGKFLRVQLGITGDFNIFTLQYFGLSYRARPQHSVYFDTGYILAAEPGQVVWIQHVEFDAITAMDAVTMEVWLDDVLYYSVDVDTSAHNNERYPFVIPVPRGTKARRPRLVFKVADNGAGAVGFDCYSVRIKMRSTGNQNGEQYLKVFPVGEAS
jgi:hypothetical protein